MKKHYLLFWWLMAVSAKAQNVVVNLQNNTSEFLMPLANRIALGFVASALTLGLSAIVCARILRKSCTADDHSVARTPVVPKSQD